MRNTSLIPIRWLITPFAAIAAFYACQELFSLAVGLIKPTLFPSLVFWTASDWCGTAFAILTAVEIAPAKKSKVAVVFAGLLCAWHAILLYVAPRHPIAPTYSHETIVITALGGFLLAGYLVFRVRKHESVDIRGDELVQVMMQQIAESRAMMEAEMPSDVLDFPFDRMPEVVPIEDDDDSDSQPEKKPVTRDMLLLERELRYIGLERTAYISAIRFAIAVERDAAYSDCRGDFLLFHQIVLDSSMRLSVMPDSEPFWKLTASEFRRYENLTETERKELLHKTEMILPIEREPESEVNAESGPEILLETALIA
ncbi:MAG TPA: hypothetical protein V6C76_14305 [Drouetiella sp.]